MIDMTTIYLKKQQAEKLFRPHLDQRYLYNMTRQWVAFECVFLALR